jgi:hypothetical protein
VEIHRALNYDERFRLPVEPLFEAGRVSTPPRVLPSPEDALLIVVCHALVHVVRGFDGRWFGEMGLMVEQEGFSWERFWERARPTGIVPFAVLMLRYFEQSTGRRIDPFPRFPRCAYAELIARRVRLETHNRLPVLARRALVELPFVRDPLGLLRQRLLRKTAM